jgi:hypothetical protein
LAAELLGDTDLFVVANVPSRAVCSGLTAELFGNADISVVANMTKSAIFAGGAAKGGRVTETSVDVADVVDWAVTIGIAVWA